MKYSFTRRSFLKGAVAAAAGFPVIVPASVFGAAAPNNRIVLGSIGTGYQGIGDLKAFLQEERAQVVAVCDVKRVGRNWRPFGRPRVTGTRS